MAQPQQEETGDRHPVHLWPAYMRLYLLCYYTTDIYKGCMHGNPAVLGGQGNVCVTGSWGTQYRHGCAMPVHRVGWMEMRSS